MMVRLLAGADESEDTAIRTREGPRRDRGGRRRASRRYFAAMQDPGGRSGVRIEHHDDALVAGVAATVILGVDGDDLGSKEHRLLQHAGHDAECITTAAAYGDDQAVRLVRCLRGGFLECTRCELEARRARETARYSVTVENPEGYHGPIHSLSLSATIMRAFLISIARTLDRTQASVE